MTDTDLQCTTDGDCVMKKYDALAFDPDDLPRYLSTFGLEYNRVSQQHAEVAARLTSARTKLEIDKGTTFLRVRKDGTVKEGESLTLADPGIRKQMAAVDELEHESQSLQYLLRAMFLTHKGAVALAGGRMVDDPDPV